MDNIEKRTIYKSENGDEWFLARDPGSGRVFVIHQPNERSGGRRSEIEIRDFLRAGNAGPEHQELYRLIGSLVAGTSSDQEGGSR